MLASFPEVSHLVWLFILVDMYDPLPVSMVPLRSNNCFSDNRTNNNFFWLMDGVDIRTAVQSW